MLELGFRVAGYRAIYDVYSKPEIFWRRDALLGWSMAPGATGVFTGPRPFPIEFEGHVRINSLGLRGAEVGARPSDGQRVLVLGDSVVAGLEVDEEKTFESILSRDLGAEIGHSVEVINAGVRGYGTDQSYLYYRDRGRAFHPDLVVFVASNNDLEDNTTLHRARRPFGKAAFTLKPDGSLELVGSPVPDYPFCSGVRLDAEFRPIRIDSSGRAALCWLQTHLSDHSALFTFATLRIQQNPALVYRLFRLTTPEEQGTVMTQPGDAARLSPAGRLTTALIRKMAETARADGSRFLLVIDDNDLAAIDAKALEADGIPHFSMNTAALNGSWAGLTWKNDSHFNESGHRRVADALRPVLAEQLRAIASQVRAGGGAPDPR